MKWITHIFIISFITVSIISAQDPPYDIYGKVLVFKSDHTSFPHIDRKYGHTYKGEKFSAEEHYSDQSVLVFIPNYFEINDSVDLTFYFHGWRNNIYESIRKFNLIKQFYDSRKNGIFVLAETAKNSPDSFGGKLEENDTFHKLVNDILLKIDSVYNIKSKVIGITLAGHSGAYRVIANILEYGGMTNFIRNIFLFDALYAESEKYLRWIDKFNGRFINIYTPDGGTKSNSENLMKELEPQQNNYKYISSDDYSIQDLRNSKIIFIDSKLKHNEVLHTNDQFRKFLESSL